MIEEFLQLVIEENEYKCIGTITDLEKLLQQYMLLAEPYLNDFVKITVARQDFIGAKVKFHEYIELMEYLSRGFSESDIVSGLAHKSAYEEAHSEALFREYELCQKMAEVKFKEELPKVALLLADPLFELQISYFESQGKGVESSTDFFISAVNELCTNPKYQNEQVTLIQVKKAMQFFQKMGYDYRKPELVEARASKYLQAQPNLK